jgi:hypothetical protein
MLARFMGKSPHAGIVRNATMTIAHLIAKVRLRYTERAARSIWITVQLMVYRPSSTRRLAEIDDLASGVVISPAS